MILTSLALIRGTEYEEEVELEGVLNMYANASRCLSVSLINNLLRVGARALFRFTQLQRPLLLLFKHLKGGFLRKRQLAQCFHVFLARSTFSLIVLLCGPVEGEVVRSMRCTV